MTSPGTDAKWTPPYAAFKTILNLAERMERDGAVPPQIDRSFLSGSEGGKTQTLAALRSLGLIGKQGEVLGALIGLVNKPTERPRLIRQLVERHYPEQNRLSGMHATQRQLEESFNQYDLTGETRRKAIAFYLHTAKYAQITVSKNFKTPRTSPTHGAKRGKASTTRRRDTAPPGDSPPAGEAWLTSRPGRGEWPQTAPDPALR